MYAYLIVPPFAGRLLRPLRELMQREHLHAKGEGRTWVGRLVLERMITQILVISDHSGQRLPVNDAIVAELRRLNANYVTTVSLEVGSEDDDSQPRGVPRLVP